jgi:FtsZ-binding cell division protein ZapB
LSDDIHKKSLNPPAYPSGYFLKLLNLERKATLYYRRPAGTPRWWERRARKPYTCGICDKSIEIGERYIGCRKLEPGYPGIYGWRGTYHTYYFHIKCLLKEKENMIKREIARSKAEIKGLSREISDLKAQVDAYQNEIKTLQMEVERARMRKEEASFWRKLDKWVLYHLIRLSKNMTVSRLKSRINAIIDKAIPPRQSQIAELKQKINSLEIWLKEIQARIEEIIAFGIRPVQQRRKPLHKDINDIKYKKFYLRKWRLPKEISR